MANFITNFKNRDFLMLWLAQVISQFGDRINQMALIGLIAGRAPGSAMGLAKLLAFTIIPVFIVGPVAGVYVDRWDRRKTLFVCDFLRGLLVLTIPLVFLQQNSMVPIYIVVFLAFCLSRFYVPAKMSIIPDLVDNKDLLVANSMVSLTGMIAFVMGCALGGFIVEKVGPAGGFFWDSVTFFISGLLVFVMKPRIKINLNTGKFINSGKELIQGIPKSVLGEIKEGFGYLTGNRGIRFIIGLLFLLFSAAGAVYVVIIVFVQEAFNSVTRHLGVLAVALGVGLFVGAVAYGKWGGKISRFKTIFFCLILGGVMMMLFAWIVVHTHNIWAALSLAFILGVIVGPIVIASNTVVHQLATDGMRGKVFSGLEVVIHLAFLLSMFLSSFLSEHIGRYWILMGVGTIFAVAGAVGLLRPRPELRK